MDFLNFDFPNLFIHSQPLIYLKNMYTSDALAAENASVPNRDSWLECDGNAENVTLFRTNA